jgi:hypothetical protein
MPEINDDIIARVYQEYTDAPHTRAKTEVLVEGVKQIFMKLHRYINDKQKLEERSEVALHELEADMNRYYFHDKNFIERITYEAKAYVLELQEE